MELKEFLEKFLPDFESKAKKLGVTIEDTVKLISEDAVKGAVMKSLLDYYYFSEALQNFADRICKKQRENCANTQHISVSIYKEQILNAEQPKIDEL